MAKTIAATTDDGTQYTFYSTLVEVGRKVNDSVGDGRVMSSL